MFAWAGTWLKVEQKQQYQALQREGKKNVSCFSKLSIAPEVRNKAFGLRRTQVKTDMCEGGHLTETLSLVFWALHRQHGHCQAVVKIWCAALLRGMPVNTAQQYRRCGVRRKR